MIYELFAAFSMGFLGSMHCIGMCGGLVGALSMSRERVWWSGLSAYQTGRVCTYAILGLIVGFMGESLRHIPWFAEAQLTLIMIAGIMVVLFGLNLGGWFPDIFSKMTHRLLSAIGFQRIMQSAASSPHYMRWFSLGMVNGLLPCGLVYAALSFSLAQGDAVQSASMMLAFGIGTIPAMMFAPILMRKLTSTSRGIVLKITAIFIILFGAMMIFKSITKPMMQHDQQQTMQHMQIPMSHNTHATPIDNNLRRWILKTKLG